MQGAMWVGAALTFAAAMVSLFGLRSGAAHAQAPAGQQQQHQAAVEL
jgi:hypothetical protein